MSLTLSEFAALDPQTGLEVRDLRGDREHAARPQRMRDPLLQAGAMHRISRAFVESPETVLLELAEAAILLCGADSAGISIEKEDGTEQNFYRWVAVAGEYTPFLGAELPQYPSACSICLERGAPQSFRVGQRFFDLLGVTAPLVTDGILLPWEIGGTRGTIFILAHGRLEAFDQADWQLMEILADFAATGVRQQQQQKALLEREGAAAAARTANELAHLINNPLQCLSNILYLASDGYYGEDATKVGREASVDLDRLSKLVSALLALPTEAKSVA